MSADGYHMLPTVDHISAIVVLGCAEGLTVSEFSAKTGHGIVKSRRLLRELLIFGSAEVRSCRTPKGGNERRWRATMSQIQASKESREEGWVRMPPRGEGMT